LLAKENGSSQGFPLDVYQEIFVLSSFYDKQYSPLKDRRDIWAGFAISHRPRTGKFLSQAWLGFCAAAVVTPNLLMRHD
jgi:hypothetical protein